MIMAYEYEIKIPMWLEDGRWLNMNVDDEVLDELEEVYRKAKAFDIFLKYKQHVEKYNNSDCHELERVFQGVIKEYEEDK